MHILISIAVLLILFYYLVIFTVAVVKRIILMLQLSRICNEKSHKLTYTRFPLASFFFRSSSPDITVETSDALYCIRIVTCIRKRMYYHFADEEHCVKIKKIAYSIMMGRVAIRGTKLTTGSFIAWKKLIRFKKMTIPKTRKTAVKILLFNPSPLLVSCKDERGVHEHAFNFTDIDGFCALDAKKLVEVIKGETSIAEKQKEKH